jgi:hypothetical protein
LPQLDDAIPFADAAYHTLSLPSTDVRELQVFLE